MSDEKKTMIEPKAQRPQLTPGQKGQKKDIKEIPFIIRMKDGKQFILGDGDLEMIKFSKGGRAGLKGGGICKRGMNRKAVGKNS